MAIAMRYGTGGEIAKGGSGGSGGGLTLDTLWTNPNPTSSFAAQTVPLSAGASGYKLLMISYIFSTSTRDYTCASFPVSLLQSGVECSIRINAGAYNRTGSRQFTLASDTTIQFTAASYNTNTANGYIVPQVIYGIK